MSHILKISNLPPKEKLFGTDGIRGIAVSLKILKIISRTRIAIPQTSHFISPITTTVALQLFAYYVALERGNPIDKPRNLAKTVTVE